MVILLVMAAFFGYIACAAGMFGGLFLCNLWGLGFGFSDLRTDIVKCCLNALVPFVLLGLLIGGLAAAGLQVNAYILTGCLSIFAIIWGISVTASWLEDDLSPMETVIVITTATFATMAIGGVFLQMAAMIKQGAG